MGEVRAAVGRVTVSEAGDARPGGRGEGPVAAVFRENAELRREVQRLRAEVQMLRDGVEASR